MYAGIMVLVRINDGTGLPDDLLFVGLQIMIDYSDVNQKILN